MSIGDKREIVLDFVKDDDVRQLTSKETVRLGHDLWKSNEVAFGIFRSEEIEAKVKNLDGSVCQTRLELADGKLEWHCSCDVDGFCEHLVATSLEAQHEGRGDIYKAAGIMLKNRRMLVERSTGKPAFIAPGGRIQEGESPEDALIRELDEEFQVKVAKDDLEPFGVFSADAANHPGQHVHMHVFFVKKWQGEVKPNNEVEEIRWLTSVLPDDIEVGSIFGHEVLPKLKKQDLVD